MPGDAAAACGAAGGVRVLAAAGGRGCRGAGVVPEGERYAVPDEPEAGEVRVPARAPDAALLQRGGAGGRHAQAAHPCAPAAAKAEDVAAIYGALCGCVLCAWRVADVCICI